MPRACLCNSCQASWNSGSWAVHLTRAYRQEPAERAGALQRSYYIKKKRLKDDSCEKMKQFPVERLPCRMCKCFWKTSPAAVLLFRCKRKMIASGPWATTLSSSQNGLMPLSDRTTSPGVERAIILQPNVILLHLSFKCLEVNMTG